MKYKRERASAARLIAKKGSGVSIWMATDAGGWDDPTTGWEVVLTDAVFLTVSASQSETLRLNGVDIKSSVYALVPAFGGMAKPGDLIVRNGVKLTIEYVNTFAPNGEVILHELFIKGDVPKSMVVL